MTEDIKQTFGGVVTQETEQILSAFTANFLTIDENFNSLRARIDDLETNVIAALRKELKEAKEIHLESKHEMKQGFEDLKKQANSHDHCNAELNETKDLQQKITEL